MGRITERLIRQRAEHNEGMVSTLEEVALHQQNIEKIELLGHLCPKLKILYLQNNLIGKLQNLHKLKDLEYLNLAVNNVTKLQNLQRCESLKKLDLTINFIGKAGLLTLDSLAANIHLEELFLLGNPCTDWPGYRQYVVAKLPQLKKLDGQAIRPSERIAAQQALPELQACLVSELRAEGVDVEAAGAVEDDSLYDENGIAVQAVPETGYVDEKGELRRPWCAATRILEHREMEAANKDADDKKKAASSAQQPSLDPGAAQKPKRHDGFPEIADGEKIYQKNEGRWEFSLEESPDGRSLVLEVAVGRFLDTSLLRTDLQPTFVRLLVKGKMLQLLLPCEVRLDAAKAQRNMATGHLVITMPKEDPTQPVMDVAKLRPKVPGTTGTATAAAATTTAAAGTAAAARRRGSPVSQEEEDEDEEEGGADPTRPSRAAPAAVHLATGRAAAGGTGGGGGGGGGGSASVYGMVRARGGGPGDTGVKEVRRAVVTAADDDDGDEPPAL